MGQKGQTEFFSSFDFVAVGGQNSYSEVDCSNICPLFSSAKTVAHRAGMTKGYQLAFVISKGKRKIIFV